MQIQVLSNVIKETEFKQRFVSFAKYYNETVHIYANFSGYKRK